MRVWLPRTMPGLVAFGGVLTAVPILVAVLMAGIMLDRLSRDSDALVSEGLTVVHLSIDLRDRVGALERNCRQYLAVQDPTLLDLVADRWRDTEAVLDQLQSRRVDDELVTHFSSFRQELDNAQAAWSVAASRVAAVDQLATLDPAATAIITAGRQAIDRKAAELHDSAQGANRLMFLSTLALFPLTALLTFGFSRVVARPLRELGKGITALGHSSYSHAIRIDFPYEMQGLAVRLDWLRRRLAQLEADKDRFLQHVSHELKTPLASLSEGAQLLSEGSLGALTARQQEVAQILCESAAELDSSISNLLAYAEWRSERQQLEADWFDARALLEEIMASHRLPMARRRLSMRLQVQGERLFGQRSRLRIALDNLVANAIKHAPDASAIEVQAQTLDQACQLCVRDHGPGVPDHEKRRIFEPFVRGSAAVENGIRGTGVGLSIVKETALAHKGEVYVEDAAPGARFRMAWPCPLPGA